MTKEHLLICLWHIENLLCYITLPLVLLIVLPLITSGLQWACVYYEELKLGLDMWYMSVLRWYSSKTRRYT